MRLPIEKSIGQDSDAFSFLLQLNVPREASGTDAAKADAAINPNGLLPAAHGYYRYPGSLTTPPCSEGVQWMVLKERLHVSPRQVKAFKKLFPVNARPLQDLHDRVVEAAAEE